jgi:hypothetical protein
MFDASIHMWDKQGKTRITNARIGGLHLIDWKQSMPGWYDFSMEAPGKIKVCAPEHYCQDLFIREVDEYHIYLETSNRS